MYQELKPYHYLADLEIAWTYVFSVLFCYAFVCVCLFVLVANCWERADLFALVCGV